MLNPDREWEIEIKGFVLLKFVCIVILTLISIFLSIDFQKVVHDIKDFLSKLQGTDTAELRDSLNYSLLNLHKHYKRIRQKTKVCKIKC